MAKPIKITPVLQGRDATAFLAKVENKKNKKTNSSEKFDEIEKDSARFKSLLKRQN